MQLILASSSPRRLELLRSVGLEPDLIVSPEIDETPLTKELPRQLALRLAQEKCAKVQQEYKNSFIISADTVVACGSRILGKAETPEENKKFLELLSGRRHRIYTGIAVASPDGKLASRLVCSIITMKHLTQEEIEAYIQTAEGIGKAGGYAIQGRGAFFARHLQGSYQGIVGLPLHELYQLLTGLGYKGIL